MKVNLSNSPNAFKFTFLGPESNYLDLKSVWSCKKKKKNHPTLASFVFYEPKPKTWRELIERVPRLGLLQID